MAGTVPGDNLFSQSLVCLDARTGERVWHFQTVHHGIWDYDLPAPPVLLDITVDGRDIPAVAQVTKQGLHVRVRPSRRRARMANRGKAGRAEYRARRETSATQPFPTLPEPFEQQGVTEDNLNDLTPEIHAEARRIASNYTLGTAFYAANGRHRR